MTRIVLAFTVMWVAISALALNAQAAPFGSSEWWQQMDREGRGGRS
jgi:hypothetical protein